MQIIDDTPEPGSIPEVYPKHPPVNLLLDAKLLRPANLFAFEGIDGSGKSTVVREVARRWGQRNRRTDVLKLGRSDLVRHALPRATWRNSDPITLNLLNWVSIFEQVTERRELFNTDSVLLFDRYIFTIKVRGVLEGLAPDFMELLELKAPRPRVSFLLDCDPLVCRDRIIASGRDITYFESGARVVPHRNSPMIESDPKIRRASRDREPMLLSHLARMREEFRSVAASYENVRILDASGAVEGVVDEIMRVMERYVIEM
jgi:thymidylate kinase